MGSTLTTLLTVDWTDTCMKVKKCRICKQVKTTDMFHRDRNYADGLNGMCAACKNTYNRQRRAVADSSVPSGPVRRSERQVHYKKVIPEEKQHVIEDFLVALLRADDLCKKNSVKPDVLEFIRTYRYL